MTAYPKMTAEERKAEYAEVTREYEELKARGLNLNMARGKPGKAQLDLVSDIFSLMQKPEDYVSDGVDVRNYGELSGLPAAKRLFAEILGCRPEQVFVGGNASLQLMYDTISKAYTHGLLHSERPWCREPVVKFLCPAPGYDRHFKVTESFGFELVTIPMTDEGPDMDAVEKAIQDPAVKGMWNVPKYSNPDGIIYSAETIRRIASMKPAAPDFLLMWDNAYCIHEFEGDYVEFPDILAECEKYGNADMVFEFASTSKVTLPGAGISIGLTRLFYVLGEQKMLNPDLPTAPADVLILPMTEELSPAISFATALRDAGVRAQLHCEKKKFKQKLSYADKLSIPYAAFLGEDEIQQNKVTVKDLTTGQQQTVTAGEAVALVQAGLAARAGGTPIQEPEA